MFAYERQVYIEEAKKDPELCFAALKLIEQLYHDGHISSRMFHNILMSTPTSWI